MKTLRSLWSLTGEKRLKVGARGASLLASAVLAGGVSCVDAQTAQTPTAASAPTPPAAPQAAVPSETARPIKVESGTLLVLVRSTLTALDQANKTGNYSVLRDMGAPDFAANNSPARLAEIFASERRDELDMANVAVLTPQLTLQPEIEPNGMLHFAGLYPAGATQLRFEFLFQSVSKQLRLYGLAVNLAQAGAVAPEAKAPPANAPVAAAPVANAAVANVSATVAPTAGASAPVANNAVAASAKSETSPPKANAAPIKKVKAKLAAPEQP